jgi:hypothetical protein
MVRDDRWDYVEMGKKIHPSYRMDMKDRRALQGEVYYMWQSH